MTVIWKWSQPSGRQNPNICMTWETTMRTQPPTPVLSQVGTGEREGGLNIWPLVFVRDSPKTTGSHPALLPFPRMKKKKNAKGLQNYPPRRPLHAQTLLEPQGLKAALCGVLSLQLRETSSLLVQLVWPMQGNTPHAGHKHWHLHGLINQECMMAPHKH